MFYSKMCVFTTMCDICADFWGTMGAVITPL